VAVAAVAGLTQPIRVYFGARPERYLYLVEWFTALGSIHPGSTFIPVQTEPGAPAGPARLSFDARGERLASAIDSISRPNIGASRMLPIITTAAV
jgi:hypothetical protein